MITTYKLKALLVLLSGLLLFPHILQAAQKIDPSQPAGWSRTGGYVSGTPSSNTEVTWTFSVNESGEYILIFASPNNSWGEFDLSLGYTQISSINQEHLNSKSRASSGHDDFVVLGFSGENGSNPSAFTLANGAAYTIRATNITSANSSHPRVGSLYIAKKTVQPDVLYFNQNYYHSAYTVKTESGDYSLASAGGLEGGSCGTQSTAMLLNYLLRNDSVMQSDGVYRHYRNAPSPWELNDNGTTYGTSYIGSARSFYTRNLTKINYSASSLLDKFPVQFYQGRYTKPYVNRIYDGYFSIQKNEHSSRALDMEWLLTQVEANPVVFGTWLFPDGHLILISGIDKYGFITHDPFGSIATEKQTMNITYKASYNVLAGSYYNSYQGHSNDVNDNFRPINSYTVDQDQDHSPHYTYNFIRSISRYSYTANVHKSFSGVLVDNGSMNDFLIKESGSYINPNLFKNSAKMDDVIPSSLKRRSGGGHDYFYAASNAGLTARYTLNVRIPGYYRVEALLPFAIQSQATHVNYSLVTSAGSSYPLYSQQPTSIVNGRPKTISGQVQTELKPGINQKYGNYTGSTYADMYIPLYNNNGGSSFYLSQGLHYLQVSGDQNQSSATYVTDAIRLIPTTDDGIEPNTPNTTPPSSNEPEMIFIDVGPNKWYADAVNILWENDIAHGSPGENSSGESGHFYPGNEVTRADFLEMALRASPYANSASFSQVDTNYTDVDSSYWASGYIAFASGKGFVHGYKDGTFKPENTITRAEAGKIIVEIFGVPKNIRSQIASFFNDDCPSEYSDIHDDEWYCPYLQKLREAGIMKGYSDGTFGPADLIVRAEAAVTVCRAYLYDQDEDINQCNYALK